MEEIITYAQNLEDVRLWKALKDSPTKTYVDIGAGHATNNNVTRWFYDHGWRGISVEPGPNLDSLREDRPQDLNIGAAISEVDGTAPFFVYHADLDASSLNHMEGSEQVQVQTVRLDSMLEAKDVGLIDFLKIDVEGGTVGVLNSNDWERFRPRVLVIESRTSESEASEAEWESIVLDAGYQFAVFDGINRFYTLEPELIPPLQEQISVVIEGIKKYEPPKQGGMVELETPYLCFKGDAEIYARGDAEIIEAPPFNRDLGIIDHIWQENAYRVEASLFTGGLTVDIGANIGAFTSLVLASHPRERVLAVEPDDDNFAVLEKNIESNRWKKRTTLKKVGVWGNAGFGNSEGVAGSVSVVPKNEGRIQLISLNELLGPYSDIDALKISTQGAEYEIVAAATEHTLRKAKWIAIQYHPTKTKVFGWMVGHLATTHQLTILGRPEDGGMLWGHRM